MSDGGSNPVSGGGGSGGGGGGGGGFRCEDLVFETNIAPANQAGGQAPSVGDVLQVVIQTSGGNPSVPVVVAVFNNVPVGSIIQHLADLLRCLQAGNPFAAEVLALSGGMIRVQVRPA